MLERRRRLATQLLPLEEEEEVVEEEEQAKEGVESWTTTRWIGYFCRGSHQPTASSRFLDRVGPISERVRSVGFYPSASHRAGQTED